MANDPHGICMVTMKSANFGRTRRFYRDLFGWELTQLSESFLGFEPPSGVGGGFILSPRPQNDNSMTLYIEVPDIASYLRRVGALGGAAGGDVVKVPGFGAYALIRDPDRNRIGLWRSDPDAGAEDGDARDATPTPDFRASAQAVQPAPPAVPEPAKPLPASEPRMTQEPSIRDAPDGFAPDVPDKVEPKLDVTAPPEKIEPRIEPKVDVKPEPVPGPKPEPDMGKPAPKREDEGETEPKLGFKPEPDMGTASPDKSKKPEKAEPKLDREPGASPSRGGRKEPKFE